MEGFRVVEVPVAHRPRTSGRSHFGTWDRLWSGIADVRAVRWMWKRRLAWVATERGGGPRDETRS
jgi:dolichol-phosphate mannosyltransferase